MSALKWVRWDTELLSSPKWAVVPDDEFGVFAKLVLLAALNTPPGTISGKPHEVALVIHSDPKKVEKTLTRLEEFGTVRQRRVGWVFVNFAYFNPAARYLSHGQRGSGHPERGRAVVTVQDGTEQTVQDILAALYTARGLLADPEDAVRVARLMSDYPDRDILAEAKKAADWTQTSSRPVKNFWLFFRNWLERSRPVVREVSADERRAQLRGVS